MSSLSRATMVALLMASAVDAMVVFPKADGRAGRGADPQSRSAQMTRLLSKLIDSPADAPSLLREAEPMLLAPFIGVPEEGSVYGDEESLLEDKVEAYEATMSARIDSAAPAQAAALESMLVFVLDSLGFERTADEEESDIDGLSDAMRLRGGGKAKGGGGFQIDDPQVRDAIDSVLRETERGAKALRKKIKPLIVGPTMTDAVFAGAAAGFATGKILFGDPKLLAMAGAAAFAYAHSNPENCPRYLRTASRRCSELTREAREFFTQGA